MKLPAYLRALAAKFLHRSRTESDMDEELGSHIQHRADDLERSGRRAVIFLSRELGRSASVTIEAGETRTERPQKGANCSR